MVLAFYQHADFAGERGRPVVRPKPSPHINLHFPPGPTLQRLMAYFDEVSFDRHGVLHGEFVLLENALALLSRRGELVRINSGLEDISAPAIDAFYAAPWLQARIAPLLDQWDTLPLVEAAPVLTEPYFGNYYHFSLDLVPRLRFFGPTALVALPRPCLEGAFQASLLTHTLGCRTILPLDHPIRVRDPRLAHGLMSLEAVAWLRRTVRATTRSGTRRLYIHRPASMTRKPPGGGIVQTPDFLAFLARFGFETIDFGSGGHSIPAQLAMLDNAGLILAAHGASLTNLAYLNAPLTVIEIFGRQTVFAGFLHIADSLSFEYHGVLFEQADAMNDIIVDCDRLEQIMQNL